MFTCSKYVYSLKSFVSQLEALQKPTSWKNEALICNKKGILWTGVVVKIIKTDKSLKWESSELFIVVKDTKKEESQKWKKIYMFFNFFLLYEIAWTLFLNYDLLRVCASRVGKINS